MAKTKIRVKIEIFAQQGRMMTTSLSILKHTYTLKNKANAIAENMNYWLHDFYELFE